MQEKLLPIIFAVLLLAAFLIARSATEPLIEMPPRRMHKSEGLKRIIDAPTEPTGFNYDPSQEILPSAIQRAEAAIPVRRWRWRDDSAIRGQLWNVAETETAETLAAGLHRVCTAEAEGHPLDCIGIWQTIRTIRNASCNRERVPEITECYEDGSGETLLSAMRRAQKVVMGMVAPRRQRQVWIANITPACERPAGLPAERPWNQRACLSIAALARDLVTSDHPPRLPTRATPITWGGSFDDHIACGRGLARIPLTGDGDENTHNTFWCRPGSRGCAAQSDCASTTDTVGLGPLLEELLASEDHGEDPGV